MGSGESRPLLRWVGHAVLVAAAAVFVGIGCGKVEPDTIAVVGDFSGTSQAIGLAVRDGARFARDGLRERFGLNLRLLEINDSGIPRIAEREAFKIAADPRVLAVVGHSQSGTTARAQGIYGRYELPLVMPAATNPDITVGESIFVRWEYAFRLVPTDDNQAQQIADYARYVLKANRALVLHDDSRYGRTLGRSLARSLVQKQIEVRSASEIPRAGRLLKNRPDVLYVEAARLAISKNFDLVAFAGYYAECEEVVRQLRLARFEGPIFLTDGCFQTELMGKVTDASPLFISFVAPDWSKSARAQVPELRQYVALDSPGRDLSYEPFAYDAVMLVAQAVDVLRRRYETITRSTVATMLRSNELQYQGMAGPYHFEGGDNLRARNYLFRVDLTGGRHALVEEPVLPR